jgi:hypothetical protein
MILADWIVLGCVLLFAILGLAIGFGNGLKFFTSHIFGFIISIVVTYFLFGVVSGWPFVQTILENFTNTLKNAGNTFCDFLLKIGIQQICLAVVIFIVVQILRLIVVKIIVGIFESKNAFMKLLNQLLGLVLFVAVAAMLVLIVFQVIYWIGGSTEEWFLGVTNDSKIGLKYIYENNPLRAFIDNLHLYN